MDRSRERLTIEEYNRKYTQDMLERDIACDTTCTDLGTRPYRSEDKTITSIDWLLKNLPGVNYVLDRMVNYFFANGLATGEEEADKRLNAWLYERKNKNGATNESVLRQAIRRALAYGECGIREYNGDIYTVPVGYYGMLTDRADGIDEVAAYYIRKDRERVTEEINRSEWQAVSTYGDIMQWFSDKGYILLDRSQFIVLRNDTSNVTAESPLLSDKYRIDLITAVYDQLNYDIRYDGPGRTFFFAKDGYAAGDVNDISTGEVLNNTPEAKQSRIDNMRKEIRTLMDQIKHSSSDMVGVLSGAFDREVLHLPRVTKGTDFLDWLDIDTVIMAQVLGMSPVLVEVGELHGNVSMEKLIDNAMLNTIIPKRDGYATQFSEFIASIANVPKVYFDKYDLAQVEDENEAREKVSIVIRNLATAAKNAPSDELVRLIDESAQLLRSSLYDANDTLKKL